MKSIEPYMKLGWHTVPLKGKLERLADGKKTIPKFEEGWRDKDTKEVTQHFQSFDDGDIIIVQYNIKKINYSESANYAGIEFISWPELVKHTLGLWKFPASSTIKMRLLPRLSEYS